MFKRILTSALIFGAAALAPPATAQAQVMRAICGERTAITERLTEKFGEHQKGAGLVNQSRLFELWSSAETGSWTVLMTNPDGTACVMATGQGWYDNVTPAERGSPA